VVCGIGYEAFWNFVEGYCGGGLEAEGEEGVCWDMVVVLGGVGVGVGCGGAGGGGGRGGCAAVFVGVIVVFGYGW